MLLGPWARPLPTEEQRLMPRLLDTACIVGCCLLKEDCLEISTCIQLRCGGR